MNLPEMQAHVAYRQAECRRVFAEGKRVVGGGDGKIQTQRDRLAARVEAARRRREDYPNAGWSETELAEAEEDLDRFDRLNPST